MADMMSRVWWQITIAVSSVTDVVKMNTAMIIPNAVGIYTTDNKVRPIRVCTVQPRLLILALFGLCSWGACCRKWLWPQRDATTLLYAEALCYWARVILPRSISCTFVQNVYILPADKPSSQNNCLALSLYKTARFRRGRIFNDCPITKIFENVSVNKNSKSTVFLYFIKLLETQRFNFHIFVNFCLTAYISFNMWRQQLWVFSSNMTGDLVIYRRRFLHFLVSISSKIRCVCDVYFLIHSFKIKCVSNFRS